MSFNKDYLWSLFQGLKTYSKIYLDAMNEQADKIPKEYVVIERQVADESIIKGDSKVLYRSNSFNILIFTGSSDKTFELSARYETILEENNIEYSKFGPTKDPGTGRFSTLISGSYVYGR